MFEKNKELFLFARNLINQIADNQTKVIVVDFTGEYRLKDPSISTIIEEKVSKDISSCLEEVAKEKAKFANQQDKGLNEGHFFQR